MVLWLAGQPTGFKSKIKLSDIEYLNLSDKDVRAAKAPADRAIPTLEQIGHVINGMPSGTAIEKRNRALLAFIALTGIRDGAAITLRLKHVDLTGPIPCVIQNPNQVSTKNSKRIDTFFFPIGEPFAALVLDWIHFLKTDLLFGNDDPLFPKTATALDADGCFDPAGLTRAFWATASPIRDIFRLAFLHVGLPSYRPHSFRHMLVQVAYQRKLSHAQLKAWSQNLGHESLLTTLSSYGKIPLEQQGQLIGTSTAAAGDNDSDFKEQVRRLLG